MKLFLQSIVLVATIAAAPLAQAQAQPTALATTNTGTDTNFDNGNNFTSASGTGTVPGPNNILFIFPGFTTEADTTNDFIDVVGGGTGTITLISSNNHSIAGLLVSSNFDTQNATNGVLNLTFNSGSTLTVGALGTAIIGGATVNFTGNYQQSSASLEVGSDDNAIDAAQTTGAGTLNLGPGTVNLDGTTSFVIGNGANGTVSQNSGSILNTGETTTIGMGTGTATYTVNSGATLNIGTQGAPVEAGYSVDIGSASRSSGTLNIDGGTLNAANPDTTIQVGGSATGTGTFTQNGTVNLAGAGSELSIAAGGNYQLQSGALSIGTNNVDTVTLEVDGTTNSTGTFTQSGGTLVAGGSTTVTIGDTGSGLYSLSGGTADFQNGFTLGNQANSVGTFAQSAGALTAENTVTVGNAGMGIYNLSGGTATFNGGLVIGSNGTFTQTGGTAVVPMGQAFDLTTAGATYNLDGGTLQISSNLTGAGTMNFGGGTLQPAAGTTSPLVDALNGNVSGNSTLDTTNANITLSGNLSGTTGSLGVIGGGIVNLTGADSAAGFGVNVQNGTLNASAANFPASGNVVIGSGGAGATGTFNLAVAGGAPHVLTGNISSTGNSGTGAFNINFATAGDTLELAGNANSYRGNTTLAGGGTFRVFHGTFGNIGGNGAVAIGGDTAVATSGTVNLAGTNSYSGTTTVNNGFTLLTNNLSGNLTVDNLGAIGSGLTMASLPANQTTTVALGGTFNSTGSILVNSNGTVTDLYTVNGTSTLSGNVVLSGVGNITNHVIINSPAGLNTAGLTLATSGSGVLFTGSIHQVGNTEVLTTVQNPSATYAQTGNQRAVANVIDPILISGNLPANFLPIGTGLNNLTASQIPGGLEQLTPESLQYARNIAFENSTMLAVRMNNVDADIRAGYGGLNTSAINVVSPGFDSGLGRSLGSLVAYNDPAFHQTAPNGVNYYPGGESTSPAAISPSASGSSSQEPAWDSSHNVISDSPNPYLATSNPSGPETPAISEFIGGDVVLADLNRDQGLANAPSSKARYTAADATAGVSFRMTSHLAAGVLFDYNHTDAKTDSSGSKTTVDSYSPGIFGTYYDHGFYANGLFSFGYNNYSNTRDISIVNEQAKSSPSGQQYVGDLDLGYDFKPAMGWVVGPTLGATYTHLDVDSFTETGATGADLAVQDQSADSLRTRLGGHLVYQTNTGDVLLQPNFTAMWQHEFLDDSSGITSSFNDFSSNPFTIQTAAPSRDSALIGIGLSATLSNSMTLYINYIADVGASDYFAQSVVGGFKARF
jgi:fibronectin-binding autotransporter adhesin